MVWGSQMCFQGPPWWSRVKTSASLQGSGSIPVQGTKILLVPTVWPKGGKGISSLSDWMTPLTGAYSMGVWAGKVRNYGFLLEHTDFKGKTWAV